LRGRTCGGPIVAALALVGAGFAQRATLTIESWRNDDLGIWQNTIIPAFNAHYPDIEGHLLARPRRPSTTPS
jgi:raffinose/stachyose/melibiose transport system substrate-binding protein